MTTHPRFPWSALLAAAGILAGCGGGSGDTDAPVQSAAREIPATPAAPVTQSTPATPAAPVAPPIAATPAAPATPPAAASPDLPSRAGPVWQKTIAAEDFHRHEMKGFSGWDYSYANASLKLLISAIGPKPLLDHLEKFKGATQNPEERAAAGQFIQLIHDAYNGFGSVDTQAFIRGLQKLAPFDRRNAMGDLEFTLDSESRSNLKEHRQLLPLLAQLWRLDTLPGWSFDIDETLVHQGQERARKAPANSAQMFRPVQLDRVKPEDIASFNLQKLVDLLHADGETRVRWNEADADLTPVKVRKQVSIADVEHFKRLTISLEGAAAQPLAFSLKDAVTLPVINRKTGQKIVLTLAPRQAIVWNHTRWAIRIRGENGQWTTHDDSFALPTRASEDKDVAQVISFAVTRIAPAP